MHELYTCVEQRSCTSFASQSDTLRNATHPLEYSSSSRHNYARESKSTEGWEGRVSFGNHGGHVQRWMSIAVGGSSSGHRRGERISSAPHPQVSPSPSGIVMPSCNSRNVHGVHGPADNLCKRSPWFPFHSAGGAHVPPVCFFSKQICIRPSVKKKIAAVTHWCINWWMWGYCKVPWAPGRCRIKFHRSGVHLPFTIKLCSAQRQQGCKETSKKVEEVPPPPRLLFLWESTMATSNPVLIITLELYQRSIPSPGPYLTISREPLFTKTNRHDSMWPFAYWGGKQISPMWLQWSLVQHNKCQGLYLCSWSSSRNIFRSSWSMLSQFTQKTFTKRLSSHHRSGEDFMLLCPLPVFHLHNFLHVRRNKRWLRSWNELNPVAWNGISS